MTSFIRPSSLWIDANLGGALPGKGSAEVADSNREVEGNGRSGGGDQAPLGVPFWAQRYVTYRPACCPWLPDAQQTS